MPEDESLYLGKILGGRYRVIEVIGRGGMAIVYRAVHELIGREVAIKILLPKYLQFGNIQQRFIREAQAVNLINHDNVVGISDVGETEEGIPYLVMDFLKGSPLLELLERFEFPIKLTLDILLQVCEGIGKAHNLNIVHRDLSASNIFLIQGHGRTYRAKILDFGIAFIKDEVRLTAPGMVLGTPWYMAPEVFMGSMATPASDIYSLGCVAYEMLSGRLPFEGEDWQAVSTQHLNKAPQDINELVMDLPGNLGDIVMTCLGKTPSQRFRDGNELAAALQEIIGQPDEEATLPGLKEEVKEREPVERGSKSEQSTGEISTGDHLAMIDNMIDRISELGKEVEQRAEVLKAFEEKQENAWMKYNIALDALKKEEGHVSIALIRAKKGKKTGRFDYTAALQAARLKVIALEDSVTNIQDSKVVSQDELERAYAEVADLIQKKAAGGKKEPAKDTQYNLLKKAHEDIQFQINELTANRDASEGHMAEKKVKIEKELEEVSEERMILQKELLAVSSRLVSRKPSSS